MADDPRPDPARRPDRAPPDAPPPDAPPPEADERPAPGVKHEPEPDAENIVPAQHRPGTL